jgi:hypothetical protein
MNLEFGTSSGPVPRELAPYLYQVGTGAVEVNEAVVRLSVGAPLGGGHDASGYSNSQLDDYHINGVMRWRPPVRVNVRARFSHPSSELRGTAGFGFWNDPFGMTRQNEKLPKLRMPQTVWFFFASRPSDMPLAQGVPGFGWKAATLDASRPLAMLLLPFAPLGILAFRWGWLCRKLWPLAQRILKVDEMLLPIDIDSWHEYGFSWDEQGVRFEIDGKTVLTTRHSPRGWLGFVAWIDNQYMVATPQGRVQHGILLTEEQWLEIASLQVIGVGGDAAS